MAFIYTVVANFCIDVSFLVLLYCVEAIVMPQRNYNRIKAVLAEKGITNRELAAELDKTEATVSRWCTNDIQPSVETLFQIAQILQVDVRELLVSTKK
jgi:putative transcriptional regulator